MNKLKIAVVAFLLLLTALTFLKVYNRYQDDSMNVLGVSIGQNNFQELVKTQPVGYVFEMCNLEENKCALMGRLK